MLNYGKYTLLRNNFVIMPIFVVCNSAQERKIAQANLKRKG
jgi:hypothetical protein